MNEVFLASGGGLGDLIWSYHNDADFLSLKAIKEFDNPHVTLFIHTHNDQCQQLYKLNPYIDNIIYSKWKERNFTMQMKPLNWIYNTHFFKKEKMPIFLTPEERIYVDNIYKNYPNYVVLHPFAGGSDRSALNSPIDVKSLIDKVISLGYTVILIGGTSMRDNAGIETKLEEKFDYERKGLINTVNKVGVRISTELSFNTKFFIGSESCYIVAAVSSGAKVLGLFRNEITTEKPLWDYKPVYINYVTKKNKKSMILRHNEHYLMEKFVDKFFDVEEIKRPRIGINAKTYKSRNF